MRKNIAWLNKKKDSSKFSSQQIADIGRIVHSYTQRASVIKKETGKVLQKASKTAVVNELKQGMTKQEFMSKYGFVLTEGYVPKYSDLQKELKGNIGTIQYKEYGRDVLKKLDDAIKQAKAKGFSSVELSMRETEEVGGKEKVHRYMKEYDLDTKNIMVSMGYSSYMMEKAADEILLQVGEVERRSYLEEKLKSIDAKREAKLRRDTESLFLKYAEDNRIRGKDKESHLEKIREGDYEEVLGMYKSLVGDRYKEKGSLRSVEFYKKYHNKEIEDIDLQHFERNMIIRNTFLGADTESSYYIENYYAAIRNQDDITNKDELITLLNSINKDILEDILIEGDFRLDMWYRTKDGSTPSRQDNILRQFHNLYELGGLTGAFKSKAAENTFSKTLKDLGY